ncbi:MAG: SUMF1/EgtB/PvdO family nonheme iron enzyme [Candidatus Hydrogenedentota bacterium]
MIEVVCAHCGLRIMVPPTVQGRRGVCFNCGNPLVVPAPGSTDNPQNLTFAKGDRVSDRYTIRARIGKGGMGVVYEAVDTLVREPVALKFMNPRMLNTDRGRSLFIQEAQIARRLRHENIVATHDVSWTTEGVLYLSMELLQGQSLRNLLRHHRNKRQLVSVRLAVTCLRQVLAALEYAHRTVIHRDIKPENVFILPGEHVKMLDFGLAKAVHEALLDQSTAQKQMVGTLAYAAPEQRRNRQVDLRADIYAVGLLLHELFTLRTPLDEPVTVPQVRDDISPSLLDVLKRALRPEKELRWQSAGEFRTALDRAFRESYGEQALAVHIPAGARPGASTEHMVYLEGGSFLMGNNAVREEAPETEVYVAPFWMDSYPVTVAQYTEFLEATGTPEPKFWRDPQYNGADQPVVGITWNEAMAYAEWAGKNLPTEIQWEFAARGKENRTYPWGSLPPDTTLANFGEYLGMPSIVTMHEDGATPEGIQDMAGNVYEWTKDPFRPYNAKPNGSEHAPETTRRAVRGGSWESPQAELRCTARRGLFAESRLNSVGFRCVLNTGKD